MSNPNFPRFHGLNAGAAPFVPRTPPVPRMEAGAGLAGRMFGSGGAATGTGETRSLATTVHGGATSVLAGPISPASSGSAATSALATTGDTSGIAGHLGGSTIFVPSSRDAVYVPISRDIRLLPIGQFHQDHVKLGSASAGVHMINSSSGDDMINSSAGDFSSSPAPRLDAIARPLSWVSGHSTACSLLSPVASSYESSSAAANSEAAATQPQDSWDALWEDTGFAFFCLRDPKTVLCWRYIYGGDMYCSMGCNCFDAHGYTDLQSKIRTGVAAGRSYSDLDFSTVSQFASVFSSQHPPASDEWNFAVGNMQQQQQRSMTPSASRGATAATDAVGEAPPADADAHSGTSSSAVSTDMSLVRTTPPPSPSAAAVAGSPSPTTPGPGNGGATPTTGADENNVGEINDVDYPRLLPFGPGPAPAPAPARSSSRAPERRRRPKITDRKARLCEQWMQHGKCPKGARCYDAHGLEDQIRVPVKRMTHRKDRCWDYLNGQCRNGVNCSRPHEGYS
uniref:C3H1-type domain-containing protein n=1 Tax=Oryza punctata TaxID=4537 RepID=A0A0E0LH05_ORYPU